MKIKQRETRGVSVLDIVGAMEGGHDNLELVEVVELLAADGKLLCVVNCRKVGWIASQGIGILVAAQQAYTAAGGKMNVCCLNDRSLPVYQVTQVHLMMNAHTTEEDAVAELRADAVAV